MTVSLGDGGGDTRKEKKIPYSRKKRMMGGTAGGALIGIGGLQIKLHSNIITSYLYSHKENNVDAKRSLFVRQLYCGFCQEGGGKEMVAKTKEWDRRRSTAILGFLVPVLGAAMEEGGGRGYLRTKKEERKDLGGSRVSPDG